MFPRGAVSVGVSVPAYRYRMAATTAAGNEALVRRIVEEVWNRGNLDLVDELYGEKFVGHVLGDDDLLLGPGGYRAWVQRTRTEFPDLRVTLDEVLASEALVCGQWTLTGTNEGDLGSLGLPPTGRSVEYSGLFIARVETGEVVEEWNVGDSYTALVQLGLLSEPEDE